MSRITTIVFIFAIPRTSIWLRENFRGLLTTEEETNQRATGLAPPAYLNTLAAPSSVFRCQSLHPLLEHRVCHLCQMWPSIQKKMDACKCNVSSMLQSGPKTAPGFVIVLQDTFRTVFPWPSQGAPVTPRRSTDWSTVTFWTVRQVPDALEGLSVIGSRLLRSSCCGLGASPLDLIVGTDYIHNSQH